MMEDLRKVVARAWSPLYPSHCQPGDAKDGQRSPVGDAAPPGAVDSPGRHDVGKEEKKSLEAIEELN
jgi:hypothetical protein